jgi:hypothetical protein
MSPPAFSAPYGQVEAIEAGPWHERVATPESQTQGELVARILTMRDELTAYVESVRLQCGRLPWADYQEKTVNRCIDLMEYESGFCSPDTVQFLEDEHGLNLEANTGEVVGQYAEFSLLPDGHGMR